MRRTMAILKEFWSLYWLWRHNLKVMRRLAKENARYYTNIGTKCTMDSEFFEDTSQLDTGPIGPFQRFRDINERLNDAG